MTQPLYPDQMVFLTDTFYLDQETLGADRPSPPAKRASCSCRWTQKKALTLTETLTAVFFVMEHIRKAGYELSTMAKPRRSSLPTGKAKNTASLSPTKKPEPTKKVASPCVRGGDMRPSLFVCGVKLQRLRAGRGDVGRCRAGASVYSHESPSARHFSSASSCPCRAAAIYQRFACSASRAVQIPAS